MVSLLRAVVVIITCAFVLACDYLKNTNLGECEAPYFVLFELGIGIEMAKSAVPRLSGSGFRD
jgi:hypothetical protein